MSKEAELEYHEHWTYVCWACELDPIDRKWYCEELSC